MIQDHVDHADHGASKERIFRARSFGRIRIRICDPRSRRSRCIKGTDLWGAFLWEDPD